MLSPTKHEHLATNILVVGSDILKHIRVNKSNIEDIYQYIRNKKDISIEKYFDVITYLWICDFIVLDGEFISISSNPESQNVLK